jgi:hypothetical protein
VRLLVDVASTWNDLETQERVPKIDQRGKNGRLRPEGTRASSFWGSIPLAKRVDELIGLTYQQLAFQRIKI